MHTILYIDELAPSQYAARFSVHAESGAAPLGPPIELERAFPDQKAAMFALLDEIASHAEEQYGIDRERVTMEKR